MATQFFPLTEPIIQGPATRVMSLRDGTKKMSKSDASDNSRINLTDDADAIAQKIRRAKTDPEPLPTRRPALESAARGRQSGRHLRGARRHAKAEVLKEFGGAQFSAFKPALADLAVAKLSPIAAEMKRLVAGPGLHRFRACRWGRPRTGHRGRNHERRQGHRRFRAALTPASHAVKSGIGAACRCTAGHASITLCDDRSRAEPGGLMSLKRRSYEAGHKPKFLVIIDESPECDRAVYYASRRAARTGASVMMLLVIEPHDRHQQWLGVADIMKAEAHEAANLKLDEFAARANGVAGITPERVIRDGDTSEQILKLIDEDEDIAILVLAAGTGKEGPGPLVAGLGKVAGSYPIPVAIVPGHLGDEDLDALS